MFTDLSLQSVLLFFAHLINVFDFAECFEVSLIKDDEEHREDYEEDSEDICIRKVDPWTNSSVVLCISQSNDDTKAELKAGLHKRTEDCIP